MITNDNKLIVLQNFQIDRELPKYKERRQYKKHEGDTDADTDGWTPIGSVINVTQGQLFVREEHRRVVRYLEYMAEQAPTLVNKLRLWAAKKVFYRHGTKKVKEVVTEKQLSVQEFFAEAVAGAGELAKESVDEVAGHYEKAIAQAVSAGQKALAERLGDMLEVVRMEATLVAGGVTKYVTEDQVARFYDKADQSKRDLKLTWVKNFTRVIPTEVVEKKKELDGLMAFDNYLVLHYDPKGDGSDMTKEQKRQEKKRKRDPILFGALENSDKLYFVADWKDDYCDLTLDAMLRKLGDKAGEMNNATVRSFIDTGGDLPQPGPAAKQTKKSNNNKF